MTASRWTGRTAALAVLLLAAFGGCSKNHNDTHQLLPIKASISIPNSPGSAPIVYLRVSSGDIADDDVVPLDLVLRAGGTPIAFDAFDVEVHLENPSQPGVPAPGILQFVFASGGTQKTPFGTCGGSTTCTAQGKCDGTGPLCATAGDCLSGVCTTSYTCDNAVSCNSCLSCPANPTFSAVIMNPLCNSNLAGAGTDGVILLGVASVPNVSCPQTRTLPANSEMVIAQFLLVASAEGTVRIRFQQNPAKTGDCEILAYGAPGTPPADLGIPFDDGGAVFTAHR
jgi:hypothetical protein